MLPNLTQLKAVARDVAGFAQHKDRVAATAKLMRTKLPAIREGLKLISKSDKNEALSIGSLLGRNASERPNDTALLYEDRRYSLTIENTAVDKLMEGVPVTITPSDELAVPCRRERPTCYGSRCHGPT